MSAFPITFVVSACLLAIFIIYFARTHSGQRKRGVDQESLLPLEEETPRLAGGGSQEGGSSRKTGDSRKGDSSRKGGDLDGRGGVEDERRKRGSAERSPMTVESPGSQPAEGDAARSAPTGSQPADDDSPSV